MCALRPPSGHNLCRRISRCLAPDTYGNDWLANIILEPWLHLQIAGLTIKISTPINNWTSASIFIFCGASPQISKNVFWLIMQTVRTTSTLFNHLCLYSNGLRQHMRNLTALKQQKTNRHFCPYVSEAIIFLVTCVQSKHCLRRCERVVTHMTSQCSFSISYRWCFLENIFRLYSKNLTTSKRVTHACRRFQNLWNIYWIQQAWEISSTLLLPVLVHQPLHSWLAKTQLVLELLLCPSETLVHFVD